jgi:type IV pilus assembly protein PilN
VIRINLLAVERERTKRRALIPAAHRVAIGASLILIGSVLLIGWWFWSLHQTSQRVDADIARGEAETQQLRAVLAQVQRFESRKAQLQQRVTLIEQLRKGQTGPVHLLDHVSRALPDSMWLTDLKNTGADVAIDGRCTSLNSLSDFVSGLEGSKLFAGSVEIVDSRVELATNTTPELIRFSVKGKLLAGAAN